MSQYHEIRPPLLSRHLPSSQWLLSLLPAAQRSAHELPMVERQDTDSCLVYGGQQMILTGQNFTAESKVVFTEKTTGRWIFELFLCPLEPFKSDHLFLPHNIGFGGWIPPGSFIPCSFHSAYLQGLWWPHSSPWHECAILHFNSSRSFWQKIRLSPTLNPFLKITFLHKEGNF